MTIENNHSISNTTRLAINIVGMIPIAQQLMGLALIIGCLVRKI